MEKEKEMRASLSRVKPIGVNCNRLRWVRLFHLGSEGEAINEYQPGEAQRKQEAWPGDVERPFKVTFNRMTDNHGDRKYGLNRL